MNNLWLYLLLAQIVVLFLAYLALNKKNSAKVIQGYGYVALTLLAGMMLAQAWWSVSPASVLLVATYAVWMFSLSRLINSRQSQEYVKRTVYRDSRYFVVISCALLLVELNYDSLSNLSDVYAQSLCLIALFLFISTLFSLKKYHFARSEQMPAKLPSVTLAIPARNETHALKQSLEKALVSNYEKLEILVLDDCSQDATAEMIKSFAHDGVRFVQGADPSEGWIGKNLAYRTLMEQASGDIIIFCGVDVHLSVDSISQLVALYSSRGLKMLSVLPERVNTDFLAHIIQPVRYFWQLSFPRYFTSTPAAISSLWMIDRQSLTKAGGFNAVQNSLAPEAYFAKRFNNDGKYAYLLDSPDLGITSKKKAQSQVDTSVRLLYPTLKRSFALSWVAIALILSLLVAPFVGAGLYFVGYASYLYLVAAIILTLTHLLMLTRIAPAAVLSGLISLPLSMIAYVILIAVSAWEYEFGEINWKGRNVCIPALRYNKN